MKDAKTWIIGILLSVIFTLFGFSVHRELSRQDVSIRVLHERINDVLKTKEDKEDHQRELNFVWKQIDRLNK